MSAVRENVHKSHISHEINDQDDDAKFGYEIRGVAEHTPFIYIYMCVCVCVCVSIFQCL